jgi:hypothetical protein
VCPCCARSSPVGDRPAEAGHHRDPGGGGAGGFPQPQPVRPAPGRAARRRSAGGVGHGGPGRAGVRHRGGWEAELHRGAGTRSDHLRGVGGDDGDGGGFRQPAAAPGADRVAVPSGLRDLPAGGGVGDRHRPTRPVGFQDLENHRSATPPRDPRVLAGGGVRLRSTVRGLPDPDPRSPGARGAATASHPDPGTRPRGRGGG